MKKEHSFITVIGRDQKGIVAKISNILYRNNINIEDISQKVMEGVFVMTMLVDMSGYKKPLSALSSLLDACGRQM
jgi:ACT domain-containing protein